MALNVNAFETVFAAMESIAQQRLKTEPDATVTTSALPNKVYDRVPTNFTLRLSANRKRRMREVTCRDYRVQGDLQHLIKAWRGAQLSGNKLTHTKNW